MARLIYSTIASLDGYIADAAGKFDWAAPDEEVHTFVNDLSRSVGTYLLGRRMYEVLAYWDDPPALDEQPSFVQEFAEIWQAADKVVYSRTLETARTARTRIERDFDADAVRQLKAQSDHDLAVGGPELAALAIKAGLVDDYQLFVVPVVVGAGTRACRWTSASSSNWWTSAGSATAPCFFTTARDRTSVMATGLTVGGDVEQALEGVGVPSYVLDTTGIVRWINPAAERLLGDVRGRHITSVVAPEDSRRARELFTRKVLGTSAATDAPGVLLSTAGERVAVEISAVPLKNGEQVVGVFGLLEERPDDKPMAPHPHLTPRQVEVLRLLEQGRSTKQIAAELHLSTETVRNHIRRLFRALGVNSRLEAVAAARGTQT